LSGGEPQTTTTTTAITTQSFDSRLEKILNGIYEGHHTRLRSDCDRRFVQHEWNQNNMEENNKQLFPRDTIPRLYDTLIQIYARLGTDLNYQHNDKTPLMAWASHQQDPNMASQQLKIVKTLLECRANQNTIINGNSALKVAVNDNNSTVVALLLRNIPTKKLVIDTFHTFIQQCSHVSLTGETQGTIGLQQLWIIHLFIKHIKNRDDYDPSDFQEALQISQTINFSHAEQLLLEAVK